MILTQTIRHWASRTRRDSVTLWFACKHSDTPFAAKALAAFTVAYALSPIDLVPDFIPVLGYLDDLILLPGLIWLTIRVVPRVVLEECRVLADEWLGANAKPRIRWGIAFVVLVWALGAGLALKYLA